MSLLLHWRRAVRVIPQVAGGHRLLLRRRAASPSDLIFTLHEVDAFSVKLLLDALELGLDFGFFTADVCPELASELVELLDLPRELRPNHRWCRDCVLTAGLDIGPNLQHHVDDVVELSIRCRQHGRRGHYQLLHGLKEVNVQVLVPAGQKAANLIAVAKEGDPLFAAWRASVDDVCDRLLSLADKVQLFVSDRQRGHRQIPELDLFVQHVHCSVEATLDIVLDVVGPHSDFVHKAWVVRAGACCKHGRRDVVLQQGEAHVRNRNALSVVEQAVQRTGLCVLFIAHVLKVGFRLSDTVFGDYYVWPDEEVFSIFLV